ncbi:hypothetical protein [Streptomyces sp. SID8499]|uniref:hypothetical protein n=1 Tax=Streptomyces sp. SID8499 TaxID=2706106 RepID=UPI0013C94C09|nr:hypothetical protein [Streptomyces sp. SID8499]NED31978.1 hypothetical protein [Streptomyces sp. SID8499]
MANHAITRPCFTVDQVCDLPLSELLPPLDAEVIDVDVNEPGFFGQLVEKRSGHMVLAMPSRQTSIVRDVAARMLIAAALGLEMSRFPSVMQTTVLRDNGEDSDPDMDEALRRVREGRQA